MLKKAFSSTLNNPNRLYTPSGQKVEPLRDSKICGACNLEGAASECLDELPATSRLPGTSFSTIASARL
jgi:hypothetical protein